MAETDVETFMQELAVTVVTPHGSGNQRRRARRRKPKPKPDTLREQRSAWRQQRECCQRAAMHTLGDNLASGAFRELCDATVQALERVVPSLYVYMYAANNHPDTCLQSRGEVTSFWLRHRAQIDTAIRAMERDWPTTATPSAVTDGACAEVGAVMTALALEAQAADMYALLYAMVPMMASVIGGPSLQPYMASDKRSWLEAYAVSAPGALAATLPYEVLDMLALQIATQCNSQFYMRETHCVRAEDASSDVHYGALMRSTHVAERLVDAHLAHAGGDSLHALADCTGLDAARRPTMSDVASRRIARDMHWIRAWSARVVGKKEIELQFGVLTPSRDAIVRVRRGIARSRLPDDLQPETLMTPFYSQGPEAEAEAEGERNA